MLILEVAPIEEFLKRKDFIAHPDDFFCATYSDEMIESDFGRSVVSTIDKIPLIGTVRESCLAEGFQVEDLCTGTKNLFNCKYFDYLNRFSFMGPNCHPFLLDIACEKDVRMAVTGFAIISPEILHGRPVKIVNIDEIYTDGFELCMALSRVKVSLGLGA